MDTTKAITHLSLCSGYEGIGLGLRRVFPNLREIAYVEREGFPIANLVAKMEAGKLDAAPVFTDVKTFPYRKFRGIVDILSGGFPCQPFSAAGKRQATEDPRHLFPYIADGIRECQPRIVFLENVQGILSCKTGDGEPVLQYVLRELEGMGYRATAGIFSAEEVGAPHQRKRVFILGVREELGNSASDGCQDGRSEAFGEVRESQEGRVQEPQGTSSLPRYGSQSQGSPELANSNHEGLEGHQCHSSSEQGEPIQADTWSAGSTRWPSREGEELANSRNEGLQGGKLSSTRIGGDGKQEGAYGSATQCSSQRWPSRPGEPQHEWEEPRVVVNTTSKGLEGSRGSSLQGTDEGLTSTNRDNGEAEPQLGRTSNGSTCGVDATANRVDRLRLLGNGVVNQTAAKAFVTLINRLI